LPDDFIDKLKSDPDVTGVIPMDSNAGNLRYTNGLSDSTYSVFNLFSDDIAPFLKNTGAKLISGRLPQQSSHDILIDDKFARQNDLKAGDYIGSQISQKYGVPGKYQICGIYSGSPIYAVVSNYDKSLTKAQVLKKCLAFTVRGNNPATAEALIKDLPKNTSAIDNTSITKTINQSLSSINLLYMVLLTLMLIVLCIALGNINVITYTNRLPEFAILGAIGYKKRTILFKLWKENAIICLAGYIFGVLLTEVVTALLNLTVLYAQGKVFSTFSMSGIQYAFAIPFFVSFFSILPGIRLNSAKHAEQVL
jgi:putative ABC transport system permease protein